MEDKPSCSCLGLSLESFLRQTLGEDSTQKAHDFLLSQKIAILPHLYSLPAVKIIDYLENDLSLGKQQRDSFLEALDKEVTCWLHFDIFLFIKLFITETRFSRTQ